MVCRHFNVFVVKPGVELSQACLCLQSLRAKVGQELVIEEGCVVVEQLLF